MCDKKDDTNFLNENWKKMLHSKRTKIIKELINCSSEEYIFVIIKGNINYVADQKINSQRDSPVGFY